MGGPHGAVQRLPCYYPSVTASRPLVRLLGGSSPCLFTTILETPMLGIYITIPLNLGSVWIEWRERSVGFGQHRQPAGDREFFVGRVQGVWSPTALATTPHAPEVTP